MAHNRIVLQDSAAQGASSQSASKVIPTVSLAHVYLDITAASGTTPTLDVWLQGSDDGVTWFDLPYDLQMSSAAAATDLTAGAQKRNINGGSSAAAAGQHVAVYKHLGCKYVRAAWVIGGTTPSFTFSVVMDAK